LDFVDYISKVAPEGETCLLVKQKPVGKEQHADGTIKATWPAFYPHEYKEGGAWYANTASFIVDRFKSKPSASIHNCDHVAFLVLDDVGTKSKAPPLEPTWKIETSPDNFQWGYTFALDDQPTHQVFSAAIKAIAEAGFTDKGATNAVRNFRIPGSVNLKPERNGFKSVLTEFHPEREFSLPQIMGAFGVTSGPVESNVYRPIKIDDDGTDNIFAWLAENSLVISRPNSEGWAGVVCPNSHEHTDGNPQGRYNPAMRAYCCLHSHCLQLDSHIFLEWVEGQGGPSAAPGLRDELLAKTMAKAYEIIAPTAAFPDDVKKRQSEIENRELGRVQKREWFGRFAYIQSDDSYFDLQDRREISRGTFNALYRHVICKSIRTGRHIEASVCFDELRQENGAPALVGITYAAGDTVLVSRGGDVYGNRWRDARPVAIAGDITPWLEHCRHLVPDADTLEHCFNVMAYKLQHPQVKINHAVLHTGVQGSGKDTMWYPFIWAVCGDNAVNRGLLDSDTMSSQFNYALESEILILNELREPDAKDRRALANKLKPIIAAPPEYLSINRKGLKPYDMVNRCLVLAFSNDAVPITLDSQDRRWFALKSNAPRMAPEVSAKIWSWFARGGVAACAAWLYARDVSAFNPSAAPPVTEFKLTLIEQGMSANESYLVDMIRERRGVFAGGVIASPFHVICDTLSLNAPGTYKVSQGALLHALLECSWFDCGRLATRELTTKKQVYCAPDMVGYKKTELRVMAEGVVIRAGSPMAAVTHLKSVKKPA
jgi:hypothetical protein